MLDFFSQLFDTSDFMARWHCGDWTDGHGWLHILSDLAVWGAYVAIPCVLGYFVLRRRDIPFRAIFLLFGAFILACGTTHLMEAIIFWWPAYRLAGVIKLITAVVSWGTVIALIPVTPRVLAMRSPTELEREVAARKQAEQSLARANVELQHRIDALKVSEERFRLLVDGTKEYAIFLLDPAGKIVSWNPGAQRIEQYQAEEIIGQPYSLLLTPEDVETGKAQSQLQIAADEGKYEEEGWRVRKDGSRFWASVLITALRDDAGQLRGFAKVTRDMTEHKQAEEVRHRLLEEAAARRAAETYADRISEEREKLRITLDSIGDGVITTDAEGRVASLNRVAQALTGWGEEARGASLEDVFQIVNEQSRQIVENPVDKVLREGCVVGLANHTVLIAKDGSERPIDDSAAPICGEDGKLHGVVLVFRDVAERRKADDAVRASEERLRLALDAGQMAVSERNLVTGKLWWSDSVEAMYGLPPGSFGGTMEAFAQLMHPEDRPKMDRAVALALEQKGEYDVEFRATWPDGSQHWIANRGKVFCDERGAPQRIIGVRTDVTARKRNENDARFLAKASSTLATLIDGQSTLNQLATLAVPTFADWCTIDLLDDNGALNRLAVVHVDPAKVELAQELQRRYPPDPAESQGVWQILRSGEPELVSEITDQLLSERITDQELLRILQGLGLRSYVGVPLRAKGQNLGVLTFISAESGRRYGASDLALAQDLADRAAIAIDNARLYEELREADLKKNEFLAMLAHELRNPLAPLRTALEIMRLVASDPEALQQTQAMMERQVRQLVRLVDDLLDISRISRGKLELQKDRVELAPVIVTAVETSRPLIKGGEHELTVEIPDAPIYLNGDATRLAQVFANLLNNAAKFTPSRGRISLTVALQESEVAICVRDNGKGIPAEMLDRVFEMFTQVDRSLEGTQGGLGIGLTLVRRLVYMHGGSVSVESAGPGQGSEFTIRLPILLASEEQDSNSDGVAPAATHQRRILVVDDNRDAATSMARMLELLGHQTCLAFDGPEAVEAADKFRPEVVLLDIGLPKLNGYDVARKIREQPWGREIVLIALTGWGQEEDQRRSHEAGFDFHLTKPVSIEKIGQLLAEISNQ